MLPLPYLLIPVKMTPSEKSLLVLCKILRLFVNTLTANDKYSLLNRINLTQPIQILLSPKQKNFSQFLSSFLKSTLNFEHFQKKDDPHSQWISQITVSEKSDYINVCKMLFWRSLQKKPLKTGPNTVAILTKLPLLNMWMPVNIIQSEKVYVSAMQNLKTAC